MIRQVIPRPAWAERIDPPVDGPEVAGAALRLTLDTARRVFAGSAATPGSLRAPAVAGDVGAADAAVLIALVPSEEHDDSASSVVLIRRAAHLRANPGEIAFPGGRIEPGESPLAAALREAEEEVALPANAVEVLGELSGLGRRPGSAPILAFVAAVRSCPLLEANPDEVDRVLVVPLADLVAPGRYWQERWDRAEGPARTMHFFDLGEDVIWGATAQMLHALFLRLLGRSEILPGRP
jgi:8-oxo-dGTP pyrophosphatase MutT (NUDIX family)